MILSGKKASLLLFVGDIATFVLALFATLWLRYGDALTWGLVRAHLGPFSVLFALWTLVFYASGLYGKRTCGTPSPHWRHNLRVTWNTPWAGLDVSAAWRYTGSVQAYAVSTNPYLNGGTNPADLKLGAQSYFDLSAQWRVRDSYTLRVGVNNIFDKDPPLVGNTWGGTDTRYNGNTYPGVYDALGRYLFVGVTADF